jgi:hypothetical protein
MADVESAPRPGRGFVHGGVAVRDVLWRVKVIIHRPDDMAEAVWSPHRGTVALISCWPRWIKSCQGTPVVSPSRLDLSPYHPTVIGGGARPPVPPDGRRPVAIPRSTVSFGSRQDDLKATRRRSSRSAASRTLRDADLPAARPHRSTAASRMTRDVEFKSLARRMRWPEPHETAERGLGRSHRTRRSIFLSRSCAALTVTWELPGERP